MQALLIIDMQNGAFSPETPRFKANQVIENINFLANKFRKSGDLVIFIQHDGTKENEYIPGTTDWEIIPELTIEPSDIFLNKTANDAFYQTELTGILKLNHITELIVTGSATDFCVESTVQSGLVKDYNIVVISDAHTTADRPHASAETIVNHYNWIWENLTPTGGNISLKSLDHFSTVPVANT